MFVPGRHVHGTLWRVHPGSSTMPRRKRRTPLRVEGGVVYAESPSTASRRRPAERAAPREIVRWRDADHDVEWLFAGPEGERRLDDANDAVQHRNGGRAVVRARPEALAEVVLALECYI